MQTQSELADQVGFLKNEIHTYEHLLFHSINMVISLVEDDLIVFYEIYEALDKLNLFNSNWENEVSKNLLNIGDGLNNLMLSIDKMNHDINNEIRRLSYVTENSFVRLENSVVRELQSVNSTIQFQTLLTGINTYQMYKLNSKETNLLENK